MNRQLAGIPTMIFAVGLLILAGCSRDTSPVVANGDVADPWAEIVPDVYVYPDGYEISGLFVGVKNGDPVRAAIAEAGRAFDLTGSQHVLLRVDHGHDIGLVWVDAGVARLAARNLSAQSATGASSCCVTGTEEYEYTFWKNPITYCDVYRVCEQGCPELPPDPSLAGLFGTFSGTRTICGRAEPLPDPPFPNPFN